MEETKASNLSISRLKWNQASKMFSETKQPLYLKIITSLNPLFCCPSIITVFQTSYKNQWTEGTRQLELSSFIIEDPISSSSFLNSQKIRIYIDYKPRSDEDPQCLMKLTIRNTILYNFNIHT